MVMSGASDNDIDKDAGDDDEDEEKGAKGHTQPEAGIGPGTHPQGSQNVNIEKLNVSHQGPLNVTINNPHVPSYRGEPSRPAPSYYADSYDAALHTPKMATDLRDPFETEDLERPVEEKFLVPVARAFDKECDFRALARELHLEKAEYSNLHTKYHSDFHELVYQMLVTWIRKYPEGTVRTLVEALCNSGNEASVMALKDYFDRQRMT